MQTTVKKWGNSRAIRIPETILEALNWSLNEEVDVKAADDKIIIERTQKKKNIKELFADFKGEYNPVEMDWGYPAGKEIW